MVHAVHVGRHDEPSKKAIESRRNASMSMVEHLGSLGPSGAEASEALRLMRERGLVRSSQDSFRTLGTAQIELGNLEATRAAAGGSHIHARIEGRVEST